MDSASTTERIEDLVMRFYDLIDAGDISGMVGLFSRSAVYHRPGYDPLVGRAQIEDFYRQKRVIRSGTHQLVSVVVSGYRLAVHGDFRGTLVDGREIAHRFAEFFEISENGLFSRRDTFFFTTLV